MVSLAHGWAVVGQPMTGLHITLTLLLSFANALFKKFEYFNFVFYHSKVCKTKILPLSPG